MKIFDKLRGKLVLVRRNLSLKSAEREKFQLSAQSGSLEGAFVLIGNIGDRWCVVKSIYNRIKV